MSDDTKPTPNGPGDLMGLWFDMFAKANEACQTWAGNAASPDVFRQNRSNLFKVWSDYWEHFLRSAPFLESQKRCLSSSMEFRKQINENLERLNHELHLATSQDINQLMSTLRRMDEALFEQFEQIDDRLNNISTKLDALAARLATLDKNRHPAEGPGANDQHRPKTNGPRKTKPRLR